MFSHLRSRLLYPNYPRPATKSPWRFPALMLILSGWLALERWPSGWRRWSWKPVIPKGTGGSNPSRSASLDMEKYPSGRRGSPAKGVVSVMAARVQIPASPPIRPQENQRSWGFLMPKNGLVPFTVPFTEYDQNIQNVTRDLRRMHWYMMKPLLPWFFCLSICLSS